MFPGVSGERGVGGGCGGREEEEEDDDVFFVVVMKERNYLNYLLKIISKKHQGQLNGLQGVMGVLVGRGWGGKRVGEGGDSLVVMQGEGEGGEEGNLGEKGRVCWSCGRFFSFSVSFWGIF